MERKTTAKIIFGASVLFLWVVNIFYGHDPVGAMGAVTVQLFIGVIVGGLVLFNIFLFFYNMIKPDSTLSFSIIEKFTAGIWFIIIIMVFFGAFRPRF